MVTPNAVLSFDRYLARSKLREKQYDGTDRSALRNAILFIFPIKTWIVRHNHSIVVVSA